MAKRKIQQRNPGIRYDQNHVRLRTGEGQRPDGRYCFRYTDRAGRRHAVYAPTLAELRVKEEQLTIDQHDGIRTYAANRTLNDMYELWKDTKRGIKDHTMTGYQYMYDMFVKPEFGKKRLKDIKKSDVRRFYIYLMEEKGLRITTLENVHSVIHQILQIAADDDIIRKNPSDNMIREMKLVNGPDGETRQALTLEEQKLFLNFMKKHPRYYHWYPIFFIMVSTGMRVGEITGLRHADIRTDRSGNKYISINHTLTYYNHTHHIPGGCYYTVSTPKTKAGIREIPISPSVEKAFEMEAEYQKLAGIECKSHIDGYTDFIFLNQGGNVLNGNSLNRAIYRIIRDCNSEILEKEGFENDPVLLPHFTCHVLRHTFATRAAESGVLAPKTLQSLLGHADISTTFNIYVSCNEKVKRIEITALEQYMETGQSGMQIIDPKEEEEQND